MNYKNKLREQVGMSLNDNELHTQIKKGLPFSNFYRVVEVTGISERELANCLALSKSQLNRRKMSGYLRHCESDRLFSVIEVLAMCVEYFDENECQALQWMRSKTKGLGYRRPIELMDTNAGCEIISNLIMRIAHGIFA